MGWLLEARNRSEAHQTSNLGCRRRPFKSRRASLKDVGAAYWPGPFFHQKLSGVGVDGVSGGRFALGLKPCPLEDFMRSRGTWAEHSNLSAVYTTPAWLLQRVIGFEALPSEARKLESQGPNALQSPESEDEGSFQGGLVEFHVRLYYTLYTCGGTKSAAQPDVAAGPSLPASFKLLSAGPTWSLGSSTNLALSQPNLQGANT